MMTLTKAVEAAREALLVLKAESITRSKKIGYPLAQTDRIEESLAALPDKPMTEDEVIRIMKQAIDDAPDGGLTNAQVIFNALKAHNVLFVEEK